MRIATSGAFLALLFALPVSAAESDPPAIERGVFVERRGPELVLDGTPFRFVGGSAAVLHGRRHREAMEETLDAVARDGGSVIRVWALGEAPEGSEAWQRDYAFRVGRDGWVESTYSHLDRILLAARERNLRVILVLANRWQNQGGATQLARWGGMPIGDRSLTEAELGRFWACSACAAEYREHVLRLVRRKSSLKGIPYAEDPTILAWELINEASAHGERAEMALLDWVGYHARLIRSLDPHHLISAGHIGYSTSHQRRTWRAVCELPVVDYCDAHAYPMRDPRIRRPSDLAAYVSDRAAIADAVNKPLVFGEVGFPLDAGRLRGGSAIHWWRRFLEEARALNVDGVLAWIYKPRNGESQARFGLPPDARGKARRVRLALASAHLDVGSATEEGRGRAEAVPTSARLHRIEAHGEAHRRWERDEGDVVAELPPLDFAEAAFEATGVYWGEGSAHFYGAGVGELVYRLQAPPLETAPRRARISARLSAELPGADPHPDPADGSWVDVFWNERFVGRITAPPDDGRGRRIELIVDDPIRLAAFADPEELHELRFVVRALHGVGGLCVYARDGGEESNAAPLRIALEAPQ